MNSTTTPYVVTFSVDDDNSLFKMDRWPTGEPFDKLILSCVVLRNVCIYYHKCHQSYDMKRQIEEYCCVHMPWTFANCSNKEQVSVLYQRLRKHQYGAITTVFCRSEGRVRCCYKYNDRAGIEIVANSNSKVSRWVHAHGRHILRGHQSVLSAVQCTLAVGRQELSEHFPPVLCAVIIQYALLPGLLDFTSFLLQDPIQKNKDDVRTLEAIARILQDAGFAVMDKQTTTIGGVVSMINQL